MMNFVRVNTVLAISLFLVQGCASSPKTVIHLELDQDSNVLMTDDHQESKKKGEQVELQSSPVLIESPGHISTLVIPVSPQNQLAHVRLRSWEDLGGDAFQVKLSKSIDILLPKINQVQVLLAKNQAKEALGLVDELVEQFPKVSQLKLIKVSCLIVLGERERAQIILTQALKENPENQEGKALLQMLGPQKEKP